MSTIPWEQQFRQVYDRGVTAWRAGKQSPSAMFNREDAAFLATIGCSVPELFDFVDDSLRYDDLDFETTLAFVVKAQDNNHPFFIGQVMTGCTVTGGSWNGGCLGDEEYVDILAPAQFLQKYVFFTDPTYPNTNLVFTRVKGPSGFEDVNLDCMTSPITGWKNIDAAGKYQLANVWLVKGGAAQGQCNNGPHSASSKGAFGIMVWGLDTFSSYAYPAGGNIAPINAVIIPPTPH